MAYFTEITKETLAKVYAELFNFSYAVEFNSCENAYEIIALASLYEKVKNNKNLKADSKVEKRLYECCRLFIADFNTEEEALQCLNEIKEGTLTDTHAKIWMAETFLKEDKTENPKRPTLFVDNILKDKTLTNKQRAEVYMDIAEYGNYYNFELDCTISMYVCLDYKKFRAHKCLKTGFKNHESSAKFICDITRQETFPDLIVELMQKLVKGQLNS